MSDIDVPLPIVLAGPTGSGKSAIALALAETLGGEIICADSRQVYAQMRIASAGPSVDEERRVPHIGYHVVDPRETYDAGTFVAETDARVLAAQQRGKVPILVGGTGMYLRAWRFGLDDVPDKDLLIRSRLLRELEVEGLAALYARLGEVDPDTARSVGPTDPHRVVRALEVFEVTGQPASRMRRSFFEVPPRRDARWWLLEAEQPWLTSRIHHRAQVMFARGLVDEAVALAASLGDDHRLVATMGTFEALQFARGQLELAVAIDTAAIRQRQYARRQRIWFRKEAWWSRFSAEDLAQRGPVDAAKTLLHNAPSDG